MGSGRDAFNNSTVAQRVLLAHPYHRVDHDQVWEIATTSVRELRRFLETT